MMKDFAIYTAYDKTNSDINLDYRKIMRGYSLEWPSNQTGQASFA